MVHKSYFVIIFISFFFWHKGKAARSTQQVGQCYLTTLSTFPMGGNPSAWRKPSTFRRALKLHFSLTMLKSYQETFTESRTCDPRLNETQNYNFASLF